MVVYFPRLFPLSVTTAVSASVIFEGMVSRPARVDDTVQQDFSKSTFPFLQITVHATLPFHQITVGHCSSNSIKSSRFKKMTGQGALACRKDIWDNALTTRRVGK